MQASAKARWIVVNSRDSTSASHACQLLEDAGGCRWAEIGLGHTEPAKALLERADETASARRLTSGRRVEPDQQRPVLLLHDVDPLAGGEGLRQLTALKTKSVARGTFSTRPHVEHDIVGRSTSLLLAE